MKPVNTYQYQLIYSMFKPTRILIVAGILFAIGCGSEKTATPDMVSLDNFRETTHTLTETMVITETDEFFFGRIQSVFPTSKGHVLVADWNAKTFHIFDSNGRRIGTVGKEGSGPGEFQQMGNIVISAGDTLFVQDWSNRRITAFTETSPGNWKHELDIPMTFGSGGSLSAFFHFGSKGMFGQFNQFAGPGSGNEPQNPELFRIDRTGSKVGEAITNIRYADMKLEISTNMVRMYSLPFGKSGFARASDNYLHIANNEKFGATTLSLEGDTLYHFEKPFATRPVTEELIQGATGGADSEFYKSVRADIAEFRPAFDGFWADVTGNLYFRLDGLDEENHLILSFTPSGEFISSFAIPIGTNIHRIQNGRIYASREVEGEPMAFVYTIEKT